MQHAEILSAFVVTIVLTDVFVALLLSGRLVMLVVCRGPSNADSRCLQKSWKLRRVHAVGSKF